MRKHGRYGYRFAGRPVERRRRSLAVGDYAVLGPDGTVVAVAERKTLENFTSSVVDGSLGFQLTELAGVRSAAVVVEERWGVELDPGGQLTRLAARADRAMLRWAASCACARSAGVIRSCAATCFRQRRRAHGRREAPRTSYRHGGSVR